MSEYQDAYQFLNDDSEPIAEQLGEWDAARSVATRNGRYGTEVLEDGWEAIYESGQEMDFESFA